MNWVLVDTNVLASFVTDRDEELQALTAELLGRASAREVRVLVHQAVLSELAYVLLNLYKRPSREVADILKELIDLPGVEVLNEVSWTRVFGLWPDQVDDYGNAILTAVAGSAKIDAIATFDKKFRRQLSRLSLASYW